MVRLQVQGQKRQVAGSQLGFDPDEYAHFDSPLNADLHEIFDAVDRFVARDFSPARLYPARRPPAAALLLMLLISYPVGRCRRCFLRRGGGRGRRRRLGRRLGRPCADAAAARPERLDGAAGGADVVGGGLGRLVRAPSALPMHSKTASISPASRAPHHGKCRLGRPVRASSPRRLRCLAAEGWCGNRPAAADVTACSGAATAGVRRSSPRRLCYYLNYYLDYYLGGLWTTIWVGWRLSGVCGCQGCGPCHHRPGTARRRGPGVSVVSLRRGAATARAAVSLWTLRPAAAVRTGLMMESGNRADATRYKMPPLTSDHGRRRQAAVDTTACCGGAYAAAARTAHRRGPGVCVVSLRRGAAIARAAVALRPAAAARTQRRRGRSGGADAAREAAAARACPASPRAHRGRESRRRGTRLVLYT
jgi:hypothetical protein